LDVNGNTITGLPATPTSSTEATSKAYVDAQIAGIDEVVEDTTPQLGGDLDANGHDIILDTGAAATPSLTFTGDTNTGIYSPGADQVAVATGGTGRLFVNASGNVGIGNASPAFPLDVTGQIRASAAIYAADGASNSASIRFSNANTGFYHPGSDALGFVLAGAERLRIDSSGRLLVGTSTSRDNWFNGSSQSPVIQSESSSFQNLFSGTYTSSGNGAPIALLGKARGTSYQVVNDADGLGRISFQGADGAQMVEAAFILAEVDGTPGANDMPGRLVFSTTADGASSPTERLRIDSSGRVGIGITSPVAALHVVTSGAGEIRHADGTRAVAMGSTGTISYIGSVTAGNGLALYSANEEKARIDSSGRLGIGTSSPGNYHPSYRNLVVGSTSTDSGVTIFSSTTGTGGLIFADGTSANDRIRSSITYSHANDLLNFSVNSGQSALVIDSSRRVGIGTASPAYKCDIDVTGSAVRLNSTTTGAALVISSDDAANAKIEFGDESDNDRGAITYDNPNNALIFQANAAERVRIESGGKTKFSGGAYGIERTATAAAFDLNTGNFWTCGAIAIPNPTNQVAGMMGSLRVTAAPTSFAANWKHPGGTYTAPTTFPAVAPFYVQASGTILLGSWTEGIA
jgi:hypothetical protein